MSWASTIIGMLRTGLSAKGRKRRRRHSLEPPNWNEDREQDLFLGFNSANTLLWLRQVPAVLCPFSIPYKVRARNRHTEHETLTDFTDHVFTLTIFSFHFPVHPISYEPSYWPSSAHGLKMHFECENENEDALIRLKDLLCAMDIHPLDITLNYFRTSSSIFWMN